MMQLNLETRTKASAAVVVAVAAALLLGYWGYRAHQARQLHKSLEAMVQDANQRLREALEPGATSTESVTKLDGHAGAVDSALKELKRMDATRDVALIDAVDAYLVTAREVLRRQAQSHRHQLLLADSLPALRELMRADRGAAAWPQQAVKARERLDQDFRGYRVAVETLDQLLESLPREQAKVAQLVAGLATIEDARVTAARKSALAAYKQAAAEVEKAKQLEAYR